MRALSVVYGLVMVTACSVACAQTGPTRTRLELVCEGVRESYTAGDTEKKKARATVEVNISLVIGEFSLRGVNLRAHEFNKSLQFEITDDAFEYYAERSVTDGSVTSSFIDRYSPMTGRAIAHERQTFKNENRLPRYIEGDYQCERPNEPPNKTRGRLIPLAGRGAEKETGLAAGRLPLTRWTD